MFVVQCVIHVEREKINETIMNTTRPIKQKIIIIIIIKIILIIINFKYISKFY